RIILGSGNLTVANPAGETFYGIISGTGKVIKNGSGTWTLGQITTFTAGQSTFSGGLTLNSGQLNINYGSSSVTTLSALGTGQFTIAGTSTIDCTAGGSVTIGPLIPTSIEADFTFAASSQVLVF